MRISNSAFALVAAATMLCACDASEPVTGFAPAAQYGAVAKRDVRLVKSTSYNADETSEDAVIGKQGGELRLGQHLLSVPRGAVLHPTRFRMTVKTGDNVIVELSAADIVTGLPVTTFPLSLQLKLSYATVAVGRDEVHELLVVWLAQESANGALVPVKSTQIPSEQYVVGWINHFSQYAMGMN